MLLPQPSVAVQVRTILYELPHKSSRFSAKLITGEPPQTSDTEGATKAGTTSPHLSFKSVGLLENTGGASSFILKNAAVVELLPHSSVAVKVTFDSAPPPQVFVNAV